MQLRLSTSCSRFSKKFPVIAQKVAQKSLKNNQKLLFVTKVAQKLLEKTDTFFGLKLKYANCTTKVRFLSIFLRFCGVNSVAKQLVLNKTKM